ncbi:hypothetical protein [Actinomadura sp. 6N118]|uniref:hypothetical protein n=1 Tax=Actinomadura sp. 6N118 TaxID=3375151 RepID=UPI00378FC2F3
MNARRVLLLGGLALTMAGGSALPAAAAAETPLAEASKLGVKPYSVNLSGKKLSGPCVIKSRYNKTVSIKYTQRARKTGSIKVRAFRGTSGPALGGWVTLEVKNQKYVLARNVRVGSTVCMKWKRSTAGTVKGTVHF